MGGKSNRERRDERRTMRDKVDIIEKKNDGTKRKTKTVEK